MREGRLDGTCVFSIQSTRNGKWKVERYDLTWGEKHKTSFTMAKMGYFDTPGKARSKKLRYIELNGLVITGEIRTFGLKKLQLYSIPSLIIL